MPRQAVGTRSIPLSPFESIQRLVVSVTAGPDAGTSVQAEGDVLSVGTSADNALVLHDDTVSGYHLDIVARHEGILVVDHGSTNGTRVGSTRVERAFIDSGTALQIGETVITVTAGSAGALELHRDEALASLRGRTTAMRRLMAHLQKVAASDACVLVIGETGTGKELAAHALHDHSPRAGAPFVTVDCGTLAPNLVASELFGHERGAFTGADRRHTGAFERADGGTLFLDEIGELPRELQTQLLGVMSRRRFRRVGGEAEVPVDVRIVSATNRDLRAEVNALRFRADLYFRLAVVTVTVPPLRERVEDIPLLVTHFLEECGYTQPVESLFPADGLATLMDHSWPGNVRELRNFVEATLATGQRPRFEGMGGADDDVPLLPVDLAHPYKEARQKVVNAFEALYLATLLERADGNVSKAARIACMTRSHLFDLLRKHGLR